MKHLRSFNESHSPSFTQVSRFDLDISQRLWKRPSVELVTQLTTAYPRIQPNLYLHGIAGNAWRSTGTDVQLATTPYFLIDGKYSLSIQSGDDEWFLVGFYGDVTREEHIHKGVIYYLADQEDGLRDALNALCASLVGYQPFILPRKRT